MNNYYLRNGITVTQNMGITIQNGLSIIETDKSVAKSCSNIAKTCILKSAKIVTMERAEYRIQTIGASTRIDRCIVQSISQ